MIYKKQYKHAESIKTENNSCLYLSGGGDEKQSFTLDKFFFDKIPEGGTFLYIPVALRGHDLYLKTKLWMKNVLILHQREDINFFFLEDLQEYSLKKMVNFDAVYLGGGNTWNLIEEIRKFNFNNILHQYLQQGGVVYGGSAGAIILGKRIDTQDDENKNKESDVYGLNFLNNFSLTCHFKNENGDRFKDWAMSNSSHIICLPEEAGLIVGNNRAICVGSKPCTIYFSNGEKKEVNFSNFFEM